MDRFIGCPSVCLVKADPKIREPWNSQYPYGFGGASSTLNSGYGGNLSSLYAAGGPRSLHLALKLLF
jgi:hypothetical protein